MNTLWDEFYGSLCVAPRAQVEEALRTAKDIEKHIGRLQQVKQSGLSMLWLYGFERRMLFWPLRISDLLAAMKAKNSMLEEDLKALHTAKKYELQRLGRLVRLGEENSSIEVNGLQMLLERTRPSLLERYLFPVGKALLGVFLGFYCWRRIDIYQAWIALQGVFLASQNIVAVWIVSPLREIWQTVRYQRAVGFKIVSEAAIQADLDSLERMLLEFKQPSDQPGDLSPVLRLYEQAIKHPLRNALFGDLVKLLLIQGQKSKVDLEGALLALDRLLRANELNFELMAVLPLLALLVGLALFGGRLYQRLAGRSERQIQGTMREQLRSLELSLNTAEEDLDECFGQTVLTVRSLSLLYQQCPKNELYFKEDLSELLNVRLHPHRKLWTVNRMYRLINGS